MPLLGCELLSQQMAGSVFIHAARLEGAEYPSAGVYVMHGSLLKSQRPVIRTIELSLFALLLAQCATDTLHLHCAHAGVPNRVAGILCLECTALACTRAPAECSGQEGRLLRM
eukprot:1161043-Pelagomonas_calceolata.AAC.4